MSTQSSPLLRLPLEVREIIWKSATPNHVKIYLTKMSVSSVYHDGHYSARLFDAPPLLLVNRQTNAETNSIHMRKVTLVIVDAKLAETYVHKMVYIKRNLITNFVFCGPKTSCGWHCDCTLELAKMTLERELTTYFDNFIVNVSQDTGDDESDQIFGEATVKGAKEIIFASNSVFSFANHLFP